MLGAEAAVRREHQAQRNPEVSPSRDHVVFLFDK